MASLPSLAEAYREAEAAIRSVEVCTTKMPVPALNEMRYAGYHAIEYLLAKDSRMREEEFSKTISHCRRAYFDAQSVLLLTLYARVKNIREGLGEYLHFFPEMAGAGYADKKAAVERARVFIEQLRSVKKDERRWELRGEWYEECKPHIKACRDYIAAFEAIREELCSKVDAAKRANTKETRSLWWNLAAVGIGVLVTSVVSVAIALLL